MTSAYPAITDCAVTAAAMRAAAGIIEESALPGLSVTCTSQEITVQVPEASAIPPSGLPRSAAWPGSPDRTPTGTTAGSPPTPRSKPTGRPAASR